jgi:hypothetical protein
MGFKKIQISAQNLNGLAFGFTEKHQFMTKIVRNSIFLNHKTHFFGSVTHNGHLYQFLWVFKKF